MINQFGKEPFKLIFFLKQAENLISHTEIRGISFFFNFRAMRLILFTFLMGLYLPLAAQEDYEVYQGDTINRFDATGKKQGEFRKYYPDGTLFSTAFFKDDIPEGTFKKYYPNGDIQAMLQYTGDSAKMVSFHRNGKVSTTGTYIGTEKQGTWRYFNEAETLSAIEHYKHGSKTGHWQVFFEDGKIASEEHWKENALVDTVKTYFNSGQIKRLLPIVNGKANGIATVFHPNGKVFIKGKYSAGLKHGKWQTFDTDGKLVETQNYIRGSLQESDN